MTKNEHTPTCNCFECSRVGDQYLNKLHQKSTKAFRVGPAGRTDYKDKGLDSFAKDFPVDWNTTPILANPLLFWNDWWSAKTWIDWHKKVAAKYGKDRANEVLIEHFTSAPFASPTTDFRTFDDNFIKYAKEQGFYDALFKGIGGLVGKTATALNKTVDATGNVVEAVGTGIETVGDLGAGLFKNLKWIIIAVVIGVIVFAYFKLQHQ